MTRRISLPFDPVAALEGVLYPAPAADAPLLVLAHGAGAGQHSRFMTAFAEALAALGVSVLTFDFPYVQQKRRVPDRPPVLEAAWRAVLAGAATQGLIPARGCAIGGKSMGGRIASQILAAPGAETAPVRGLVLLGYPLHPPGRPEQRRVAHLPELRLPVLVVQGERDAFGTPDEVRTAFAAAHGPVELMVIEGGDHSFKVPRGKEPQTAADDRIRDAVATWIRGT